MATILTLQEAKAYLKLQETSDHDPEITAIMNAVAQAAEDYCSRKFTYASYTERKNGRGLRAIRLDNPPRDSSTSIVVKENGTTLVVAAGYDVSADAVIDNNTGYIYRQSGNTVVAGRLTQVPGVWTPGILNIQVDYTGGFGGGAAPPMPESVKLFCKYAVAHFWKHTDRKEIGFSQRADGQRSVTFLEDFPKYYWRLIDPYRVWDGRL